MDKQGNAIVTGGHVDATVDDGSDAQQAIQAKLGRRYNGGIGGEFSRLGGLTPSVHLDNSMVHVDRFNANAWFFLGSVPHFIYDVSGVAGNHAVLPY